MKKIICTLLVLMLALCGCSGQSTAKASPADAVKAHATEEAYAAMGDALNDEDILAVFAESASSVYILKPDGAGRYICHSEYYEADQEITYEMYSNGILINQSYPMFFEKTADGNYVTNSNLQADDGFRDLLKMSARGFVVGTLEGTSLENSTVLLTRGVHQDLYKFTADKARSERDGSEYSYTFDGQRFTMSDGDGVFLDGYIMADGYIYSSCLLPLYDNFDYSGLSEFTAK